jgi:hypothetical protein
VALSGSSCGHSYSQTTAERTGDCYRNTSGSASGTVVDRPAIQGMDEHDFSMTDGGKTQPKQVCSTQWMRPFLIRTLHYSQQIDTWV